MTQAFNLSQFANKVNSSGLADLTTAVTGTLPVANGGTNQTTYTNGQLLIGNTTGNTLTKSTLTAGAGVTITNGSGAITISTSQGQLQTELFTGPGTWTCPSTTTQVRVTVIGGGAGAGKFNPSGSIPGKAGGAGGLAIANVPVSAPVTITVGAGGVGATGGGSGTSGATSSFGPFVSATGGAGGGGPAIGANGAGTVSTGTVLRTSIAWIPSSPSPQTTIGTGIWGGTSRLLNEPTAIAFSTTGNYATGSTGAVQGGPGPTTSGGGVGGIVLVEYIS
jgi:hypothetical protein